ncbi:MAG TPA: hypothetical protein VFR67_02970 [Pilimelia sp.]|nr:hypothetical protein [Pilimelia sp.]
MTGDDTERPGRQWWRDLAGWSAIVLAGLALTWFADHGGARLGTEAAPFLGSYRWRFGPASLLAPAVAAGVLLLAARGWHDRAPWWLLLLASYGGALAWTLALAAVDGAAGLTQPFTRPDGHLVDVADVGDDPLSYLRTFLEHTADQSPATRGHPPGPLLLLWGLHRVGITEPLVLAVLVAAIGALLVPLVLGAVRGVCGELPGRRYALVLVLAPYAIWLAAGMDVVAAVLGAAAVAAGVRASDARRTGRRAAGWAVLSGVLLGTAALFSYAVPWLGLSTVCLYFARRRAALNLFTAVGALTPVVAAQALGFGWVDGLLAALDDFASRVEPHRSALWWSVISLVALVLAAGPPLYASLRKVRNTPGWPFLAGAGTAVGFSVVAGLARGGVEYAWLPFFPWLTVAAVAPERQGGTPVPSPLPLVAVGALTAVVIRAALPPG